jgi:hypothetical protein
MLYLLMLTFVCFNQCFGSGPALDPNLIGFLGPDWHLKCQSTSRSVKTALVEKKGTKRQKIHHNRLT